jgi:tRNA(Met) cytidine acetyltransferase
MDAVAALVDSLLGEATATNERRLLVLAGSRAAGSETARVVCETAGLSAVSLSEREIAGRRLDPDRADELLGTTHECVVVDCHDACRPNALGRASGAVDGGGLLVLVTPPLARWPDRRDGFDETLAVPPFDADAVGGVFRRRLAETLRAHRGVAIVDADEGRVVDEGLTHPAPRLGDDSPALPADGEFPAAVYEACLTADQRDAVAACERLAETGTAVVLEADRGRGKSSAAGLAAAALAADGDDVLVTAPNYRNASALFDRACECLAELSALAADRRDGPDSPEIESAAGGRIRFREPTEATALSADAVVVDEAAALPVDLLESLLSVAPASCFATTVHGYEGAGRGFDVRFRPRLDEERAVTTVALSEPIRYAAADPVEVWLFRALLLDARPAVPPAVSGADPGAATYERLDPERLAADEVRLREAFGLLVNAHYRTEPDDLARLLDAPNVVVRALTVDGHVASVALLAREGDLPADTRRDIYEGGRIHGNMIPDVLTSQLRDPEAGSPTGLRVLRVATHHTLRSQGFGSRLLSAVEAEFDAAGDRPADGRFGPLDYLGVSYGATPALVSFWDDNGYTTLHLSVTRNDASGEHSAVMARPLSAAGATLVDRHSAWFRRRIGSVLSSSLKRADPDVVRHVLAATEGSVSVSLPDAEWRLVASAAYGPGLYDIAPGPFGRLALAGLLEGALEHPDHERLLVVKALQSRPWPETADALGYVSERACMRAFGDACKPLVDRYGTDLAHEERERYR